MDADTSEVCVGCELYSYIGSLKRSEGGGGGERESGEGVQIAIHLIEISKLTWHFSCFSKNR